MEIKTKKQSLDFVLSEKQCFAKSVLLKLSSVGPLPAVNPGQFVQVKVEKSPSTYLRRPISVHNVIPGRNELWLLVQQVGDGTRALAALEPGQSVNIILPLGNGFSMAAAGEQVLLIGGGVGVAPLLYLGSELRRVGAEPSFLLGGRTAADLLQLEAFREIGPVYTTTEDGSAGIRGFVTQHTVLDRPWKRFYVCGPKPMMQAVAQRARRDSVPCEVSLENSMACGLGACLCCVENTREGHVCVCQEGPVFNIDKLLW